jgi:hypothetical protein
MHHAVEDFLTLKLSQEVEREIRDRAYVERIFEKVKEEYAKAKIR